MTRRTALALVLAPLLCACSSSSAPPALHVSRDAERALASADAAGPHACVVEGAGDWFTGDYIVHGTPDLSSPVARVTRAEQVGARIALLPDHPADAVTLLSRTVELSGFVARAEQHFVTRERILLSESELFVERGRLVTVRDVSGGRVTADVPSPFQKAPLSIQISCENLAYDAGGGGPSPSPAVSWAAQRSSGPIALFTEPRGALVVRAETDAPIRVLEVRDGFSHVRIGDAEPWCYQGITADVWVASADLVTRDPPADHDDACFAIPDGSDRCPAASVAKRTELWLGDPKDERSDLTHIGWLKQGAELTPIGKPRDHFLEIRLNDDLIAAPPGLTFFAERTVISGDCAPNAGADGCPCGPP